MLFILHESHREVSLRDEVEFQAFLACKVEQAQQHTPAHPEADTNFVQSVHVLDVCIEETIHAFPFLLDVGGTDSAAHRIAHGLDLQVGAHLLFADELELVHVFTVVVLLDPEFLLDPLDDAQDFRYADPLYDVDVCKQGQVAIHYFLQGALPGQLEVQV